jgi:hypothetical protein
MATTQEFLIIQTQKWIVCIQEFWVEHNLDTIIIPVEELDSADLVQDGIACIIGHVVGHNRWQTLSLHGKDPSLQTDLVCFSEQILWINNDAPIILLLEISAN